MRRTHLAACAAVLTMLAAPAGAVAQSDVDSTRLESLVTVEGIHEHQQALQNIADLNGGTRYTRTAGFTASANYVKATLEKAGYDVRFSMFNMPEWEETAAPVLQQTTPNSKTYRPGSRNDDGSTAVDGFVQWLLAEERSTGGINRDGYNGTYSSTSFAAGVSLGLSFR